MSKNHHEIYKEFVAADEAWQVCLVATFGGRAGDVRYTRLGHTHPNCAEAYNRFAKARTAWYDSVYKDNPWSED